MPRARLAALATVALLAPVAAADVVELGALRDTTLYEDSSGSLANGSGSHFFAGATAGGAIRRGLLAFDVASFVPAGSEILSVELTLSMSRAIGGDADVALHRMLGDWGEGASDAAGEEGGGAPAEADDATWIHSFYDQSFWTTAGGDFAAAGSAATVVSDIGLYTWSSAGMVDDVQAWLDDASSSFGWAVLGDEGGFATAKRFDTRENGDAALRPLLRVEYVIPAPGACALFVLAGLGRRRRRS